MSKSRRPAKTADAGRREAIGFALVAIGWLLRLMCAVAIPYVVEKDWSALVFVPPLALSAGFIRWGRMHRAPRAERLLAKDPRPPVVFLRSFQDEDDDKGVVGVVRSLRVADRSLAQSLPAWGPREQEAFATILRKVGPYVAIGRPGEKLPEVGAARLYVPDEKWQQCVIDLCTRATLVIVRAGTTRGLQWELEQLVALGSPTKLLVLLPSTAEQYQRFREWVNEVLPVQLPQKPDGRLLIFDEHWTPRVLAARTSLGKSLEPYFQQNKLTIRATFWEAFLEHNGLRS